MKGVECALLIVTVLLLLPSVLLVERQEGHPVWGAGMVICLGFVYGPADATATQCLLLQ